MLNEDVSRAIPSSAGLTNGFRVEFQRHDMKDGDEVEDRFENVRLMSECTEFPERSGSAAMFTIFDVFRQPLMP